MTLAEAKRKKDDINGDREVMTPTTNENTS